MLDGKERLLLIDTCGEIAGVALSLGLHGVATEDLQRGSASAEIVSAVRRLLASVGWRLAELDGVGVVNGPGSFTGLRAGLATAKGLCEAGGLRMAAVSRLAVLADAAGIDSGLVALDAGRGELYVREVRGSREWLSSIEACQSIADGRTVVVAEERVAERLGGCQRVLRPLHVRDSLGAVMRRLLAGGDDVALMDANYLREEGEIYRKAADPDKSSPARA